MFKKNRFMPDWTEKAPKEGSIRAIVKYGSPNAFKHPSHGWVEMMMDEFGMTRDDFCRKLEEGNQPLPSIRPGNLNERHINRFRTMVGRDNVETDNFNRVKYAYGKTTEELMELRKGFIRDAADVVVHPRDKEDVKNMVSYCHENGIPLTVFAAGSSVNFGVRPERGGVSLVMSTHMNRLISINEANQTACVQPGMFGPAYEEALNKAPEQYGTRLRYTCGHFPQSFEYSTVGGWVVTLGSGQASTYYGDACDLVISQEYVTPAGTFRTREFPAAATGPKVSDIMKGSEGCFGILVEVTMKIYRFMPENRKYFSFMFPSWDAAVDASREIMQAEFGKPAVFRISDPEETHRGLKLYGIPAMVDSYLVSKGFKPMERCLCLGTTEGDRDYTNLVKKKIKKVCNRYGALYLTGYASKKWEKTRYTEPYMREDLQDYGIQIDTLEASVTWDNLHRVHQGVRAYIKARPATMCMTHASHFYPQGTNLYFIFITKTSDLDDFRSFQRGVIESIMKNGGSLSHHHGVGRMMAPYIEEYLGKEQMDVLRCLKRHFDPGDVMNPGSQLGLGKKEDIPG